MTFDNRLGLALVFTILLETAGAFIWAGRASARLERLARLEVRADDAKAALERIERRLDRDRR